MAAEDISNEAHINNGNRNWTSTSMGRLIAGSVIVAEVTPVNELLRYGAFGLAVASQDNPVVSAAVLAFTTLGIEGAAAFVAADILDTDRGNKTTAKINDVIDRRNLNGVLRTGPVSEFSVALIGGSAITTFVKHRQDPSRTRRQNRRFGVLTTVEMTATMGATGYLTARGIETPNVQTIGAALLSGTGVFYGVKRALARAKQRGSKQSESE